jgi:hypothetical protein
MARVYEMLLVGFTFAVVQLLITLLEILVELGMFFAVLRPRRVGNVTERLLCSTRDE